MKFIIWTAVWFLLVEISRVCCYGFGYWDKMNKEIPNDVIWSVSALTIFLWIFLYIVFVRD